MTDQDYHTHCLPNLTEKTPLFRVGTCPALRPTSTFWTGGPEIREVGACSFSGRAPGRKADPGSIFVKARGSTVTLQVFWVSPNCVYAVSCLCFLTTCLPMIPPFTQALCLL